MIGIVLLARTEATWILETVGWKKCDTFDGTRDAFEIFIQ